MYKEPSDLKVVESRNKNLQKFPASKNERMSNSNVKFANRKILSQLYCKVLGDRMFSYQELMMQKWILYNHKKDKY